MLTPTPATPTPPSRRQLLDDTAAPTPARVVEAALARHLRGAAGGDETLLGAGLDSLAIVRIVLAVTGPDAEGEIELGDIGMLRTVGDLREHLTALARRHDSGVEQP